MGKALFCQGKTQADGLVGIALQLTFPKSVRISNGAKGQVQASCIVVLEVESPEGEKPIEWHLLTNLPGAGLEPSRSHD